MRIRRRALAALALLAALPAAVPAAAQTVSLAVTDVPGLEAVQRDWGPFRDAFNKATGLELRFFPVGSRTAAVEALAARRIDFVLTGPAEYVVFRARTSAVPVVAFTRPDYFSNIAVLATGPIQAPADLKGQRVAFGDVGSTSRHLGPMQVLADHGLDPRRDVTAVHVAVPVAFESLRRGDVAAVGLNRTDIERYRARNPGVALRVIARGRDLPEDVMVAGSHVDAALVERVRKAFVDHSDALVAAVTATEENAKYKGMAFLPGVRDADYNYVRAMYRTIGQPQFGEFVGN